MYCLAKTRNKPFWAKLGLLLITVVWGSAFVVVKDAAAVVPPSYIVVFRFGITTVCLCLIFWKRLARIGRTELAGGLVIGIFNVLGYELQTYGLQTTTAGNSAFLTAVYCVIVPFLYWLVKKEKPGIYNVVSAFLCIAGVGFLSLKSGFAISLGDALSLLCGLSYAAQIVAIDIFTAKGDAILLTVTQSAVTTLLALPAALRFETLPRSVRPGTILALLYVALFSTMLAFLVQNIAQQYVAPSQASLIMSLESVFGVLCGILFLREPMTPRVFLGCALIFLAITLSERKPGAVSAKGKKASRADTPL